MPMQYIAPAILAATSPAALHTGATSILSSELSSGEASSGVGLGEVVSSDSFRFDPAQGSELAVRSSDSDRTMDLSVQPAVESPTEATSGGPAASSPAGVVRQGGTPTIETASNANADTQSNAEQTIVVTASQRHEHGDPFDRVNAQSYKAVQAVDDAVLKPVSTAYKRVLPEFIRDGLHNVLSNLHEPVVFVNFLLQGKVGKAGETVGRFAINSTAGAAGLFDVAKHRPINLPRRPNGFADTLGFYGVGPGPYLYLPLIGPTTVRDLGGLLLDKAVLPVAVGGPLKNPTYAVSTGVIKSLDKRVRFDAELRRIQQSDDPYATTREYYLAGRAAEIEALKHPDRCGSDDGSSGQAAPPAVDASLRDCAAPPQTGGD